MTNYETIYEKNILPKYGKRRENDKFLLSNNNIPHKYSVLERLDLKDKVVFTIDPEGCEDADDGFSIYYEDSKLFLAIHIADPTELINLNSNLWEDICNRVITHYPSFNKPIHLMPDEILKASSLTSDSNESEEKNAISIISEIDLDSYLPTNNIKLEFSSVVVNKKYRFTYEEASKIKDLNYELKLALMISEALYKQRCNKTIGAKLSEINNIYVDKNEDELYIGKDNDDIRLLKHMIGEFAILANSFVGEYLKINLQGMGIFRTCDANLINNNSNLTGREILNEIIDKGISAEYLSSISSHDLVGTPVYCHFTSPIRRLADCVCHYLLRSIKLQIESPWSKEDLEEISKRCFEITKKEKNIQYDDTKFRVIQLLKILSKDKLEIGVRITKYTGLFINCMINKIYFNDEEFDTQLSYSLRIKRNLKFSISDLTKKIKIENVNPFEKFDENSLPDLDNFLKSLFD